jgi:hypothetical protein
MAASQNEKEEVRVLLRDLVEFKIWYLRKRNRKPNRQCIATCIPFLPAVNAERSTRLFVGEVYVPFLHIYFFRIGRQQG